MSLISEVMGAIVGSDVDLGDLYSNIGTTGQLAQGAAGELATQLPGMTQFQPFTVTSGTSQVNMTPEGGFNIGLSEGAQAQQNALRQQANYYMTQPVQGANQTNLASNQAFNLANDPNRLAMTGANAYQGYTGLQNQAGDLASQFLGTAPVGALSSQGAGLQALQSGMSQMNQVPAGTYQTRDAASSAFGLGNQFVGASRNQAGDINALRGMFANQAASALGGGGGQLGQLGQLPPESAGIQAMRERDAARQRTMADATGIGTTSGLDQMRQKMGKSGQLPFGGQSNPRTFRNLTMPNGNTMTVDPNDPRLQGLSESQMIQKITKAHSVTPEQTLQAPSIGQLGQQALGLGSQGLATQAPSDVEALRSQYGQLAGQAAGNVLGSTAGRESDVYNRIRATQRPEEERQRMALEERLFNQGRSGVSTNMYGGTPEQLAMAKAQGEAQNQASLAAIQQAQSERQQSLGEAQAFGGMFGQQAGLSSNLQNQAQARASQLSQLGLSANQIESQLQSEGLGRAVTSASQAANLAQLSGGLQAQQAGLGAQFLGLGSSLSGQEQALRSAQQQRALQASTGGQQMLAGSQGLQQGQLGLGAGAAGLMGQLAQQRQGLMSQNLQDILAAQQMGAGLAGSSFGLQQAQQQLGLGALGASYLPEQQALGMLSAAAPYASIADVGRRQGATMYGETAMSGLDAMMAGQLGQANLMGGIIPGVVQGLGNIAATGIEAVADMF